MVIKTPPPHLHHLISFTFKTVLGFSHKSHLNNVMILEIYIYWKELTLNTNSFLLYLLVL